MFQTNQVFFNKNPKTRETSASCKADKKYVYNDFLSLSKGLTKSGAIADNAGFKRQKQV